MNKTQLRALVHYNNATSDKASEKAYKALLEAFGGDLEAIEIAECELYGNGE